MAILEVVTIAVKKPEELGVPGSETAQGVLLPLKFCVENNVDGYKGAVIGPISGEVGTVKAFVEWESVDAHAAFGQSDKFPAFVQSFAHIGAPTAYFHVDFNKLPFAPGGPCTKGITELTQYAYKADAVPEDAETILKEYLDALTDAKLPGFGGHAYGWVLEEQEDERVDGGKAKCLAVATGWDKKDDYEEAKQALASMVEEKKAKLAASCTAVNTSWIKFAAVE